jgi:hypothetical protein
VGKIENRGEAGAVGYFSISEADEQFLSPENLFSVVVVTDENEGYRKSNKMSA